jgi:hypothetical protein
MFLSFFNRPLASKPQSRLGGHCGKTPNSAMIGSTIKIVPSVIRSLSSKIVKLQALTDRSE